MWERCVHFHRRLEVDRTGTMEDSSEMNPPLMFGFAEEWQPFQERNREFLTRYVNLRAAFNIAFLRALEDSERIERVVFFMGKACTEDFEEIIVLAANGLGIGAQKILRGLYERAVTMIYLREHPEEVDLFLNYFDVSQYKLIRAMKRLDRENRIPQEQVDQLKARCDEVKKDYEISDCKTCGTTKMNHTWNRLNMVDMAGKVKALSPLIVQAYLGPLGYAHSTVQALLAHVADDPSGGLISLNPGPRRKEADHALYIAHMIVLAVLETQSAFFKLQELSGPVKTCFEDFNVIWARMKSAGTQEAPEQTL